MSLGYTMMTRVTFGLWGAFLPLTIVLIANTTFVGLCCLLLSLTNVFLKGWHHCILWRSSNRHYFGCYHSTVSQLAKHTTGEVGRALSIISAPADVFSAGVTTQNLIGFFLYFLFYMPVVYWVPLFKLKRFLYPSILITSATFLGMLGWVIHQNGGMGPLIASPIKLTHTKRAFLFLQCVSSTAASWGGSGDRLSDWTRFSKSRHASTPSLLTGLPITLTLTAIVGVLVTSAFFEMYGLPIWTPLGMLIHVQQVHYTPLCRAGTFFAGIGLLSSMIYVNIVQNTVAFGMDFAGLFPKYVTNMCQMLFLLMQNPNYSTGTFP
jgi:NCS1 family nucleobase:cation symporter-1